MTVAERLSPEMEAEWRARFLAERPGRWGKRRQVGALRGEREGRESDGVYG